MRNMIKIVAHRGASLLAPENTMAAFRRARELGVQAIELDVHFSKDKEIIVHHNYALGNPDDGEGYIFQTNLKIITQVDAGSWMSKEFAGEKIPLLKEVLVYFGSDLEYEIELKSTDLAFIHAVVDLVRAHNLEAKVEFTSPHLSVLSKLHILYPNLRIGVFFSKYPEWMDTLLGEKQVVDTMALIGGLVAHLPKEIATERLISVLHKNHFLVHLADCNTEDEVLKAVMLKVDQLSTNDVSVALKVLNTKS